MKLWRVAVAVIGLLANVHSTLASTVEADNEALIRNFYQEINKGHLAVIDEMFAPNFVLHGPNREQRGTRELAKKLVQMTLTAFPDARSTVEEIVAKGDKVVVRLTMTGTHKGELYGGSEGNFPPTGKSVRAEEIDIYRIAGGKILEAWSEGDALGMMKQLGLITFRRSAERSH